MNYLPRSRARALRGRSVLIAAAVLLGGGFAFALFRGPLVSLVSPLWQGEGILARTVGGSFDYWRTKRAIIGENDVLKQRVASLELQVSSLNLALSERQSLEALLGRVARPGEVIASVLTHPPQSPYDLFVIDAGEAERLTVGERVRLPEGPLLGTVTDTFPHSAKVKLYSSAGERTEAILEREGLPVILQGRGAGNFRVEVPRETIVVPGDRIIAAGVEGSLIGIIQGVEAEPTDAFKEVLASSPASIYSVRFVSVAP